MRAGQPIQLTVDDGDGHPIKITIEIGDTHDGVSVAASRDDAEAHMKPYEAVRVWDADLARKGHRERPRAVRAVRAALECMDATEHDAITVESVEGYLAARRSGDIPPRIKAKTLDNLLCMLRDFLDLCQRRGYRSDNPAREVSAIGKQAGEDPEPRGAFTRAEFDRLHAAAIADETTTAPRFERRRSVFYLLLWYEGLRFGAAQAVEWGDLFLGSDPTIRKRAATSKAKRAKVSPLHPIVADALAKAKPPGAKPTDRVFPDRMGWRMLESDMRYADVPKRNHQGEARAWHSFRRGLATDYAERGVPIDLTAEKLDHSDIRLTQKFYIKDKDDRLRRVHEQEIAGAGSSRGHPAHEEKTTADLTGAIPQVDTLSDTPHGRTMIASPKPTSSVASQPVMDRDGCPGDVSFNTPHVNGQARGGRVIAGAGFEPATSGL